MLIIRHMTVKESCTGTKSYPIKRFHISGTAIIRRQTYCVWLGEMYTVRLFGASTGKKRSANTYGMMTDRIMSFCTCIIQSLTRKSPPTSSRAQPNLVWRLSAEIFNGARGKPFAPRLWERRATSSREGVRAAIASVHRLRRSSSSSSTYSGGGWGR